jgi:hypothetical protein
MSKKEIAQFKRAEKMLANIKQARVNALVKARKGELWIEENTKQYSEANNDFNVIKQDLKVLIKIKKYPFWAHIIAHTKMFLDQPIKYFTHNRKVVKDTIKSYWDYKKILKEWDDDFETTEKYIDRDYEFVNGSEKHIKKIESVVNKWRSYLTRKLKKKVKRGTKVTL